MEPLLRIEHLSKAFYLKRGAAVQALTDINLEIFSGETLGIVGESGCGKSTLAKTIMGVYPKSEGALYFHGTPLDLHSRKSRLAFSEKVQMIFQDPYASLNPRMKVEDIIAENLVIHKIGTPQERKARVLSLLREVGLQPDHAGRFPAEFSGGQRQRIGLARALALRPELLVCDEPISALDVSIQSQIMNLLKQLQTELGMAYLFIAHDLHMVRYLSNRIAVMYRGHVVELAYTDDLYHSPYHPYTQLLLQAVLSRTPGTLEADFPQANTAERQQPAPIVGCPFANRCSHISGSCTHEAPKLREVHAGHFVACHNSDCPHKIP